jgi:polyisoprenoid-binding protein YceI
VIIVTLKDHFNHISKSNSAQYLHTDNKQYQIMKKKILSFSGFIFLLFLQVQTNAQTYIAKSAKITIDGTSTMHDWSSVVTKASIQSDFTVVKGVIQKLNSATINLETKSIKSTKNSSLMDDRTYSTLKADKFPNITFVLTKVVSIQQTGNEATVTVTGNLTIGGVTKPTDLILKIKSLANDEIEVKGTKKITMSNHGIKPPSFMLGALKVADEVTITYSVILIKK